MVKKKILLLLLLFFGFFLATSPVYAVVNRPTFSVKIRSDRRALNVYFYNQQYAKSITYELTYTGNSIDQGVVGSIYKNEGSSAYRLLLFGTCSKKVCTYHRNIKNTQLIIRSKLLNGQTLIKKYTIKI